MRVLQGGSCLRRRKGTGEKPPRTKERMQGPARKELYWHDPRGSLRHLHRPGCEPREGCPEIPAEPLGGCKEASQGPRGAVSVPKGTVPEVRLCARSCKKRWDPPRCHQGPPRFGRVLQMPRGVGECPLQKGLSFPSARHLLGALGWAGMRGCGAASSCKEKGREERDGRRERR